MKSYISYFILKYKIGLQYRASAMAGIATQIFFGLVYISIYLAFYESDISNLPMELPKLVSYLWLNQAFLAIVNTWYKNSELVELIKTGNLAYELARPQDVFMMWAAKIYGEKLSSASLRFIPVILFGIIMPYPYHLDLKISLIRLLVFIISFILASVIVTLCILLFHIIVIYTLDDKGVANMFVLISDILSGGVIPLPFFPKYIINIINLFPFRYIADFPLRLYVGDIPIIDGLYGIIIQLIWIIILYISGKLLMRHALSNVVIQGG